MKVTAVIQKNNELFEFRADLTAEQHQFLIEYALRDLVTKGYVPFDTTNVAGETVGVVPVINEALEKAH